MGGGGGGGGEGCVWGGGGGGRSGATRGQKVGFGVLFLLSHNSS